MLTAKAEYYRYFNALVSEFCSGRRFFPIRVPPIKIIKDALHEPRKFLNCRQILLVKCVKGYGTERVLVNPNLGGRQDA